MDQTTFTNLMNQSKLVVSDYAAGYQRGLRRLYHGDSFGNVEEHEQWLSLGTGEDPRIELGRGYRDGFAGRPPQE